MAGAVTGAVTRILAVGALAGSEPTWRKLVNAIALDVYRVDLVVVLGGLGTASEPAWRALADDRLADSTIELRTLSPEARCATLGLPGAPVYAGNVDAREVIEADQPKLAICGGAIDDEPRRMWLGDTLCLDPGSGAARDALWGWVADVGEHGVLVARPLRT